MRIFHVVHFSWFKMQHLIERVALSYLAAFSFSVFKATEPLSALNCYLKTRFQVRLRVCPEQNSPSLSLMRILILTPGNEFNNCSGFHRSEESRSCQAFTTRTVDRRGLRVHECYPSTTATDRNQKAFYCTPVISDVFNSETTEATSKVERHPSVVLPFVASGSFFPFQSVLLSATVTKT